jgi:hypothetical protein
MKQIFRYKGPWRKIPDIFWRLPFMKKRHKQGCQMLYFQIKNRYLGHF